MVGGTDDRESHGARVDALRHPAVPLLGLQIAGEGLLDRGEARCPALHGRADAQRGGRASQRQARQCGAAGVEQREDDSVEVPRHRALPGEHRQRLRLRRRPREPVEAELGDEFVEPCEVRVQQPLGTARLGGDRRLVSAPGPSRSTTRSAAANSRSRTSGVATPRGDMGLSSFCRHRPQGAELLGWYRELFYSGTRPYSLGACPLSVVPPQEAPVSDVVNTEQAPWLPKDFNDHVLTALNAPSHDLAGYRARVKTLRYLFDEILNMLIVDGVYGDDPIDEAFIRNHEEPGRAWNMELWNEKHRAR